MPCLAGVVVIGKILMHITVVVKDMLKTFWIVIASLLALGGCADETAGRSTPPEKIVRVVVEAVHFSNEQTHIEAVGTSRALQSVTLTPVTSGEVVSVNFSPGQQVNKDDVLVQLDDRNQKLALELARIRLDDAKNLYDRYQRTADSGAILPTVLDAARTAFETARVELDKARLALDDTLIKAPISGYVGIAEIDPGDRVDQGTVITTLDNRDSLLISFEVPEVMLGTVNPGDKISITPWNDQVTAATGDIVDIGSRIDPLTRTFTVRAMAANEKDKLRPGMSFRVSLDIKGRTFPIIPEISVQWGSDGSHVWVLSAGQVRRVSAIIIQRQQGRVLVNADLKEGDLVVVEGVQRMYDGIKVEHTVRENSINEQMDRTVKIES
jgi:membrane fusion protein, multidrug efflux system